MSATISHLPVKVALPSSLSSSFRAPSSLSGAPAFGAVLAQEQTLASPVAEHTPPSMTAHGQGERPTPPETSTVDDKLLPADELLADIISAQDEPLTDAPLLRAQAVDLVPHERTASWEALAAIAAPSLLPGPQSATPNAMSTVMSMPSPITSSSPIGVAVLAVAATTGERVAVPAAEPVRAAREAIAVSTTNSTIATTAVASKIDAKNNKDRHAVDNGRIASAFDVDAAAAAAAVAVGAVTDVAVAVHTPVATHFHDAKGAAKPDATVIDMHAPGSRPANVASADAEHGAPSIAPRREPASEAPAFVAPVASLLSQAPSTPTAPTSALPSTMATATLERSHAPTRHRPTTTALAAGARPTPIPAAVAPPATATATPPRTPSPTTTPLTTTAEPTGESPVKRDKTERPVTSAVSTVSAVSTPSFVTEVPRVAAATMSTMSTKQTIPATATQTPTSSTSSPAQHARTTGATTAVQARTAAVAAGTAALFAALQQEVTSSTSTTSTPVPRDDRADVLALPQPVQSPSPLHTTPALRGMNPPEPTPSWMAVSLPSSRATPATTTTATPQTAPTKTPTTTPSTTITPRSDVHEETTAPLRKARSRDERELDTNLPAAPAATAQRLEPVPEPVITSAATTPAPAPLSSTRTHDAVLERVQELLNDPASNVYFDGRHAVLTIDGLTVRLSTDSTGQTQVSMHTSDPARAEQLTSTSRELAHSLNLQGLQLATMQVQTTPAPSAPPPPVPSSSSSQSFSGGQQQQQHQQSEQSPAREESAFASAPPAARAPAARPARGIRA